RLGSSWASRVATASIASPRPIGACLRGFGAVLGALLAAADGFAFGGVGVAGVLLAGLGVGEAPELDEPELDDDGEVVG
ncbi:hypothetical protein K7G98_38920, partial [Saccharothrix sp. MB29]|nr:hypothetical protein [Saccharothrix sp. MB29]